MKYLYLSFLFTITCSAVFAQESMVWKETDQSATFNEVMLLENPRYVTVNIPKLRNTASAAPMEFTSAARNSNTTINLPLPDGTSQNFYLIESPVMHPNLAAKFPELKSYIGYSADDRFGTLRFSLSPYGITAIIKNSLGTSYIQNVDGAEGLHQCFARNDMDFESIYQMVPEMSCGYDPSQIEADEPYEHDHDHEHDHITASERSINAEVSELKVYEMALACTGEYGQAKGGTVPAVMASFNEAMSILNSVLQEEHGLKFELIENNDLLINLDPNTDFFNNANQGTALLQQNHNYLNSVIGNNNFDIGHIFTMSCTDVAGVVSGRACNNPNKGRGVTCHYSSIINVVSETMSHEVAHQFAAGHTWANCPNIMDQLASASAYEPGSGSTIMSYLGSCGPENITEGFNQNNRYYHVKTLEEVELFSTEAIGASCPDFIPTDNHHPEVSHNHGYGFYIPKSTPFELEAIASDVDGDQLSYCWEQYDLGPTTTLSAPQVQGSTSPLFMSVSPTDDNVRVFPKLSRILSGNYTLNERLPTVGRALNFKCTVRDGHPEAGGWNTTQVTFGVADNAGPFSITFPSESSHTLEGGKQVVITWDPANSNEAPINCEAVDIYLSTTSGNAFTLLASSVPNTGSYTTFLPNVSSFGGRIKIKASDNIFFDISNKNFSITQPTEGFFSFASTSDVYQFACLPEDLVYSFEYKGYNDFSAPVELTLVSDLPEGLNLDWETLTMNVEETADLNVTFDSDYGNQFAELQFRGIVDQDTFFHSIYVDAENADFSALELLQPANAVTQQQLAMNYSWVDIPNSDLYDIQVATNPSFEDEYIVDEEYGTSDSFYNSNEPLNKGQVYFWRVRGSTPRCGKGEWKGPFYFQTFTESCKTFSPNGLPLNISSQLAAGASIYSELAAVDNSLITDINIANVDITHDKLKDIKIFVKSPTGTEVVLHDGTCVLTEMRLSFDDESLASIPCPANTNELVQPVGSLSDFDGEDLIGIWELYVEVLDNAGAGGQIKNWELESCGAFEPNSPYLVTNEILTVRDGKGRLIQNDVLQVADEDNTAEELIFTITQAPEHGQLLWSGDADGVNVGDFFKQISIDLNHVEYLHSGNGENDSFKFIVTDGTGGLLQETTVFIELDPNAPTSTDPSIANMGDWRLSPNPSNGNFMLNLEGTWVENLMEIKVFDVEGKLVHSEDINQDIRSKSMKLNHLRNGAYSIQLIGKDLIDTKRFIITK